MASPDPAVYLPGCFEPAALKLEVNLEIVDNDLVFDLSE